MGRDEQFPPEPSSVPAARWMVGGSLEPGDDEEVALLLTSELSANAVQHARTPFTVGISHDDGKLTVEVHDHDPTPPVMAPAESGSPRGRGLRIVDAFSQEWGVTMLRDDGKTVWFRLAPTE